MKKTKILISSLLITSTAPLLGLVACGPKKPTDLIVFTIKVKDPTKGEVIGGDTVELKSNLEFKEYEKELKQHVRGLDFCELAGWEDENGDHLYDDTIISEDTTVVARFINEPIGMYIKTSDETMGYVRKDFLSVEKGTTLRSCESEIGATAYSGYKFLQWEDERGRKIDIDKPFVESKNIIARFQLKPVTPTCMVEITTDDYSKLVDPKDNTLEVQHGFTFGDIKGQLNKKVEAIDNEHLFLEWVDSNNQPIPDDKEITDNSIKAKAIFAYVPITEQIEITVLSGTGASGWGTTKIKKGQQFKNVSSFLKSYITVNTQQGYAFERWVDKDGNDIDPDTTLTENFRIKGLCYSKDLKCEYDSQKSEWKITGFDQAGYERCQEVIIPKQLNYDGNVGPVTAIDKDVFRGKNYITKVFFNDKIKSIGEYAFQSCMMLNYVNLPETLTNIDQYAFSDCRNLTEITIPNNVKVLPKGLFSGCNALFSVKLPAGLKVIRNEVFKDCKGLSDTSAPSHGPGLQFAGNKDAWKNSVYRADAWRDEDSKVSLILCSDGSFNVDERGEGNWASVVDNIDNGKLLGAVNAALTDNKLTIYIQPDLGYNWPSKENITINGVDKADIDWSQYETDDCPHNDYGTIIINNVKSSNITITATCPKAKKLNDDPLIISLGNPETTACRCDCYDNHECLLEPIGHGPTGTVIIPDYYTNYVHFGDEKFYIRQIPEDFAYNQELITGIAFEENVSHLRKIGSGAFAGSNALDCYIDGQSRSGEILTFPEGIEEIGSHAFDEVDTDPFDDMTGICFPSTLKKIGDQAFDSIPCIKEEGTCIFKSLPTFGDNVFWRFAPHKNFTLIAPTKEDAEEIDRIQTRFDDTNNMGSSCTAATKDVNITLDKPYGSQNIYITFESDSDHKIENVDYDSISKYLTLEQIEGDLLADGKIKIGTPLNSSGCCIKWSNLCPDHYKFAVMFNGSPICTITFDSAY